MIKTRRKKKDEIQARLEAENRALKAENRQLRKRLKKVDRDYNDQIDEIVKEYELEIEYSEQPNLCKDCGKGHITETTLGRFTFLNCSNCGPKGKK